jgi:endonuclease YncB( thermonuclease family)
MKKSTWGQIVPFILILFFASCSYRVIRVIDGDTIEVKRFSVSRVRLAGIDCPESTQKYGDSAKIKTSEICLNKSVTLQKIGSDKYGRIIAFVNCGQISVNKALLAFGLAWHYSAFDHSAELTEIELRAKKEHLGLWRDPHPIEPYKFRQLKK